MFLALVEALSRDGPQRFAEEFGPHIDALLTLLCTPIGVSRHPIPMDPSLFIRPSGQTFQVPGAVRHNSPTGSHETGIRRRRKSEKREEPTTGAHNVDGHMMAGDIDLVGLEVLIKTKIAGAQAMGHVIARWPAHDCVNVWGMRLISYLSSPFSATQMVSAMIIEEYSKATAQLVSTVGLGASAIIPQSTALQGVFLKSLMDLLNSERPPMYRDLHSYMQIIWSQCHSLLNTFRDTGKVSQSKLPRIAAVVQGDPNAGPDAFGFTHAEKIVNEDFTRLKRALLPTQKLLSSQTLAESRASAMAAIEEAQAAKKQRDVRVWAAAAGACISTFNLPKKLNALIHGVMESVKVYFHIIDLDIRNNS